MEYQEIHDQCPVCGSTRLCSAEGEVCCPACGAVLGRDYQPENAQSESKLNLYQATEVGTAKVNLECARHMHEANPDKSALSNACTKLELPLHASQDASAIYHTMQEQRQKEWIEYALRLEDLTNKAKKDLAGEGEVAALKGCRPKRSTKAQTAAFAIDLVCKKNGLPRADDQIIDAVMMNFGVKRKFTMLKAYSLNEITARNAGIDCSYPKQVYHIRLLLSGMQGKIGSGALYYKIMRHAIMNLQKITAGREDARAARAVGLALKGIRLHVPV
ncbi:MAG: TFIIB-type zinc ribbon-containing protein [Thaumarchaeota archaeon]|nr:TFIIB-type zinc ribbon-containing protein [Nitrososphaerota archaeon]